MTLPLITHPELPAKFQLNKFWRGRGALVQDIEANLEVTSKESGSFGWCNHPIPPDPSPLPPQPARIKKKGHIRSTGIAQFHCTV